MVKGMSNYNCAKLCQCPFIPLRILMLFCLVDIWHTVLKSCVSFNLKCSAENCAPDYVTISSPDAGTALTIVIVTSPAAPGGDDGQGPGLWVTLVSLKPVM